MTALAGLVPKLAVFLVMAFVGGGIAYVGTAALEDRGPVTTATETPDFVLTTDPDTGTPELSAFDLIELADVTPTVLADPDPDALAVAASALLDPEPASWLNPSGFPRIPPVSQFDGGPFQGANCTLAAGSMLARLGFGIVTSGSILRTLQDDQSGGTGLDDLSVALWRGYGVAVRTGLITPAQLKSLLGSGYGAVIQGDYGRIPVPLRLQTSFDGPHAIYLDGYYRGGGKEAYYVIDPLGRPASGYEGEWWPTSIVDEFGTAFGGGRIAAAWVFPPGGTPPDVVGPDIVPIPPSPGETPGGPTPAPGATPTPSPSVVPSDGPVTPVDEPGDLEVTPMPPGDTIPGDVTLGGIDTIPILEVCLLDPPPPGCPIGIPGVFEGPPEVFVPLAGPHVEVVFVDSHRPNVALVGFRVDPAAPADVVFWEADGSPAIMHHASAMSSIELLGQTMLVGRLDVLAATEYRFQVTAGGGLFAGTSPVGTFTTGDGVVAFDVSIAAAADPVFELGTGLSPYVRLASGGLAEPLVRLGGSASGCLEVLDIGDVGYCAGWSVGSAPDTVCMRAQVTYELEGVEASAVLVRAFPAETATDAEGVVSLEGVLEVEGPAGGGEVGVGCLASGLTYAIVLDAVGDDRGPLASREVTVP